MKNSKATGQSAYQKLYAAIVSGQLKPGDRLRETELATLVGLSRTPVREAIRKLESDGIVEHKPHIGAVVKKLTQQEIVELYEMRIVLEKTAAAMAAKHASPAEIRKLEDLNSAMLDAMDHPRTVADLNRQFHDCIVHAARNRYLASSHKGLSNALLALGDTTLETPERIKSVTQQHKSIIDALIKGDEAEAVEAMSVHMETSLDHRLKSLR